jgi:hypothetical protein
LSGERTRTIAPARALAAEALTLERTLSDLVNQAYALTPAEIALKWQTAPPEWRGLRGLGANLASNKRPARMSPEKVIQGQDSHFENALRLPGV